MELQIGEIVVLKKEHPCGGREWKILRVGADIKIKCQTCGHLVMLPRPKLEKQIVKNTPK
ncbi:DUF951 domain-containing protein [Clostridiales bacterium COT073_COT-073]|nr:DUF951 domain-containing protein [Clostridiales bacterium COT073_COT-073]